MKKISLCMSVAIFALSAAPDVVWGNKEVKKTSLFGRFKNYASKKKEQARAWKQNRDKKSAEAREAKRAKKAVEDAKKQAANKEVEDHRNAFIRTLEAGEKNQYIGKVARENFAANVSTKSRLHKSTKEDCQDWRLYLLDVASQGKDHLNSKCRQNVVSTTCQRSPENKGEKAFCLLFGIRAVPMSDNGNERMGKVYTPMVTAMNKGERKALKAHWRDIEGRPLVNVQPEQLVQTYEQAEDTVTLMKKVSKKAKDKVAIEGEKVLNKATVSAFKAYVDMRKAHKALQQAQKKFDEALKVSEEAMASARAQYESAQKYNVGNWTESIKAASQETGGLLFKMRKGLRNPKEWGEYVEGFETMAKQQSSEGTSRITT